MQDDLLPCIELLWMQQHYIITRVEGIFGVLDDDRVDVVDRQEDSLEK